MLSDRSLQLQRAGTMSESVLRTRSSGKSDLLSRPKSEMPATGMGVAELEASFEVSVIWCPLLVIK